MSKISDIYKDAASLYNPNNFDLEAAWSTLTRRFKRSIGVSHRRVEANIAYHFGSLSSDKMDELKEILSNSPDIGGDFQEELGEMIPASDLVEILEKVKSYSSYLSVDGLDVTLLNPVLRDQLAHQHMLASKRTGHRLGMASEGLKADTSMLFDHITLGMVNGTMYKYYQDVENGMRDTLDARMSVLKECRSVMDNDDVCRLHDMIKEYPHVFIFNDPDSPISPKMFNEDMIKDAFPFIYNKHELSMIEKLNRVTDELSQGRESISASEYKDWANTVSSQIPKDEVEWLSEALSTDPDINKQLVRCCSETREYRLDMKCLVQDSMVIRNLELLHKITIAPIANELSSLIQLGDNKKAMDDMHNAITKLEYEPEKLYDIIRVLQSDFGKQLFPDDSPNAQFAKDYAIQELKSNILECESKEQMQLSAING